MGARVEIDVEDFKRRWKRGDKLVDMAAHFGVGTSAVSRWAAKYDLPPRYAKSGSPRAERATSLSSPTRLSRGRWVADRRGILRWVKA